MATSAEFTFVAAVAAAEGVRQVAKAAAFATWAFQPGAPLTTYIAALKSADNTFINAVQTASNTAGGIGITAPNQGPSAQTPVVNLGNVGCSGPLPSPSATYGAIA